MATIYRLVTALGATLAILAVYTTFATLPIQQATEGRVQTTTSTHSVSIGFATSNVIEALPKLSW